MQCDELDNTVNKHIFPNKHKIEGQIVNWSISVLIKKF